MWGDQAPAGGPDPEYLWGELPPPRENVLGLSAQERAELTALPKPLAVEGPKFYQPLQDTDTCHVKAEPYQGDPVVQTTIRLLKHRRELDKLLEKVEVYKQGISSGELAKMPPLAPAPPTPEVAPFRRTRREDFYGQQLEDRRLAVPVEEVGEDSARDGLEWAVTRLVAHAGFVTAQESALRQLTDQTEHFLTKFCGRLRSALDHSLELAPGAGDGWADVLERVMVEQGVRSDRGPGLLALGDYYEETVVGGQARALQRCRDHFFRYQAELPGEAGSWPNQDEIPEMHFPSSDEGAGLEGDHATPTLDVGMQMLQSLEASGDLDTPLSAAESEALSGYSATPSPQVMTPGRAITPHSPAEKSAKKRDRSGKHL